MADKRKVEIFSGGCPVCEETIQLVNRIACPSCQVVVLDTRKPEIAQRAKDLGIRSIPAVAVDGRVVGCCAERGPDEASLRSSGIGQTL